MNKLVVIVFVVAVLFILTYDPVKGVPLPELYQPREAVQESEPACVEKRYLELQGITGGVCTGHPKEVGGAVVSA
jgi:hypothetical protein